MKYTDLTIHERINLKEDILKKKEMKHLHLIVKIYSLQRTAIFSVAEDFSLLPNFERRMLNIVLFVLFPLECLQAQRNFQTLKNKIHDNNTSKF